MSPTSADSRGLSLAPFRGLRPTVSHQRLGRLLSPPYDMIDTNTRAQLLATDPDNVVAVVLPEPTAEGYTAAARRLDDWLADGLYAVDPDPALYVYELGDPAGNVTRGLLGAVELRHAEDGVILPHENTMAGPVADRLAAMTATGADLEPIYLVYDGGGAASQLIRSVDDRQPLAEAVTPDGLTHRLWSITSPEAHQSVSADLATRRALIADGHHRYATYQERQRAARAAHGLGPWDRGLALLVDSSEYGPQVHAIHRVIAQLTLRTAIEQLRGWATVAPITGSLNGALRDVENTAGFAVVLTDGQQSYRISDLDGRLAAAAARPTDPQPLTELDITVLHRGLVDAAWHLSDDVVTVRYAHSVDEAVREAAACSGFAILLRPTPVQSVAAVAAAGARMPRKSTLFTPKPASGLVMRRLADQSA